MAKFCLFKPPTMRAVSFCKTSASTVTRSTSTLTTSDCESPGCLEVFWLFAELLLVVTVRSRVCDAAGLKAKKSSALEIETDAIRRSEKLRLRRFISSLRKFGRRREVETVLRVCRSVLPSERRVLVCLYARGLA